MQKDLQHVKTTPHHKREKPPQMQHMEIAKQHRQQCKGRPMLT
jgi:hypothetical protein